MAVFLPRTKPNRKNDSRGCHTILYRALIAAVFLAGSLIVPADLKAQDQSTPLIIPIERHTPEKKDNGPRAVAVLRRGANNKSSLVPIAILIDGKFWDASAYKADPVPMALESGTVYEVERDGNSLGLFTIGSALHSTSPNADVPWIGTGTWSAAGSDVGKKAAETPTVPVGINAVDGPPRLTRRPSEASVGNATTPSTSSTSSAPPSSPQTSSAPSGSSGDEPPRLTKSTTSSTPSGAQSTSPSSGANPTATNSAGSASAGSSTTTAKPADSKPGDSKTAKSQTAPAQIPADDSGASASARPRLRRGRPELSFADEDVPGYSKVTADSSATGSASTGAGKTAAAAADKAPVETIPAISDAGGPQPHSFAFQWIPGDEEDRRKQMIDLAKQQLHAYLRAQAKATIKPASAQETHHRSAAKSAAKDADPVFDDVHMTTYDLWVSNQPVIVFSAEAHMPPSAAHSQANADLRYSILLVAYPDIYNNLHPLYQGVTDKFHLDLTPRLDLVDAVDADGDGRGELLFRETSDAGTGWVIYRATADKLWKMFDSLNPE